MHSILSRIHAGLAMLTMLLIVLEFFLAGVGVFGAGNIDMHRGIGSLIAVFALLLFLVALVGQLGRQRILFSGLLLLLMIVQIGLIESNEPWIEALHPLNALAILGATAELTRRGRAALRGPAAEPSTSMSATSAD